MLKGRATTYTPDVALVTNEGNGIVIEVKITCAQKCIVQLGFFIILEFSSEFTFLVFLSFENTAVITAVKCTFSSDGITHINSTENIGIVMRRIAAFVSFPFKPSIVILFCLGNIK